MNENRRQILEMLAGGKITADEAERLLAALDSGTVAGDFAGTTKGPTEPPSRRGRSICGFWSRPMNQ